MKGKGKGKRRVSSGLIISNGLPVLVVSGPLPSKHFHSSIILIEYYCTLHSVQSSTVYSRYLRYMVWVRIGLQPYHIVGIIMYLTIVIANELTNKLMSF